MVQKILIAFDESVNAMRAVEFVASAFTTDKKITLFSVTPDTEALCDMNSPSLIPYFMEQKGTFCTLEEKKKDLLREAQQKAKQILLDAGFNGQNIKTKVQTKEKGIARDIIKEAGDEYDVIVIGRRGLSGIKEFFMGSISQKVLNLASSISILIVD